MSKPKIQVEVHQQDWIPGFAAYIHDGAVRNGKAHVVLNLGAFLGVVADGTIAATDMPYLIAESLMHEVIHVFEAWAEVEFSEEKVEGLINKYRVEMGRLQEGEELTLKPVDCDGPCADCGRPSPTWFAPNEVWNRVFPERVGIVCPTCFVVRAEAAGINPTGWELRPEVLAADITEGKSA